MILNEFGGFKSYRPKVGLADRRSELQPNNPPESELNRQEKVPERGLDAFTETHP